MDNNNDLPKPVRVGEKFSNPWSTWKEPSIWSGLKFSMEGDKSDVPKEKVTHFEINLRLFIRHFVFQ